MHTVQEVAKRLKVHPITVSRWINRRKNPLECVRYGHSFVRISDEHLSRFLAKNSSNGHAKKAGKR